MPGRWINCYSCKEPIHLSEGQEETLRRNQAQFYCLWGHSNYFPKGETSEEKLRQERDRLKQQMARVEEEKAQEHRWRVEADQRTAQTEKRLSAQRGVTTRLKNRVANGVCPCCNRTFENLARHMSTKHKGFVVEEVQSEVGVTIQ